MNIHQQIKDELIFKCSPFSGLSIYTLYDMLALRLAVFCVEQNCPYQDADGKDQEAWHVLGYRSGELVATARILAPGISYDDACSIGRVASHSDQRGKKIGQQLMARAVEECVIRFPNHPIRIGAQKYLLEFYKQFGFEQYDEPFLEDGIVHIAMVRNPLQN